MYLVQKVQIARTNLLKLAVIEKRKCHVNTRADFTQQRVDGADFYFLINVSHIKVKF